MSAGRVRRNAILLDILLNRQMCKRTDVVSTQSVIFYLIKIASIINTSFEYDHRFSQNSKATDLFSVDLHACSYFASVRTKLRLLPITRLYCWFHWSLQLPVSLNMEVRLLLDWMNIGPSRMRNRAELHISCYCAQGSFILPTWHLNNYPNFVEHPGGSAVYGVGVQLRDYWDHGFESHWCHGCLSLVTFVCCLGSGLCAELITRSE